MSSEFEYYMWEKSDTVDFWEMVERVDEAKKRELAAKRQAKLIKCGKLFELKMKDTNESNPVVMDASCRLINQSRLRKFKRNCNYKTVIELYKCGESMRSIAKDTGLHRKTISQWISEFKKEEVCR